MRRRCRIRRCASLAGGGLSLRGRSHLREARRALLRVACAITRASERACGSSWLSVESRQVALATIITPSRAAASRRRPVATVRHAIAAEAPATHWAGRQKARPPRLPSPFSNQKTLDDVDDLRTTNESRESHRARVPLLREPPTQPCRPPRPKAFPSTAGTVCNHPCPLARRRMLSSKNKKRPLFFFFYSALSVRGSFNRCARDRHAVG